jgi:hypothetical protein
VTNRYAVRLFATALIASALTTAAPAQQFATSFDGTARTGSGTRLARFHFSCSANDGPNVTGVLSVALEILRYEQLRAVFDFEAFEGPDAKAGPLTVLRAVGVRTKANDRFAAAGSINPAESFVLEVDASRREPGPLERLAAVLRPLLEGQGQLVWRQDNPKPGGTPIIAVLDLIQARADQLRATIGPCLGARR